MSVQLAIYRKCYNDICSFFTWIRTLFFVKMHWFFAHNYWLLYSTTNNSNNNLCSVFERVYLMMTRSYCMHIAICVKCVHFIIFVERTYADEKISYFSRKFRQCATAESWLQIDYKYRSLSSWQLFLIWSCLCKPNNRTPKAYLSLKHQKVVCIVKFEFVDILYR